jgi:hypothetical protein
MEAFLPLFMFDGSIRGSFHDDPSFPNISFPPSQTGIFLFPRRSRHKKKCPRFRYVSRLLHLVKACYQLLFPPVEMATPA